MLIVRPRRNCPGFGDPFPEARIRSVCVAALADSITAAHAAAPNGWGVTLSFGLRLNVGKIEVMSFGPNWIRVILDSRSFPEVLRNRSDGVLKLEHAPGHKGVLRSVPVSVACEFRADAIGELFPLLINNPMRHSFAQRQTQPSIRLLVLVTHRQSSSICQLPLGGILSIPCITPRRKRKKKKKDQPSCRNPKGKLPSANRIPPSWDLSSLTIRSLPLLGRSR